MPAFHGFIVEVDPARNLFHSQACGKVVAAHMKAAVADAEPLLKGLKKGFTVLADLTALESMDLDCAPHLSRLMDLCRIQGVGLVVRVIPDPSKDIGLNILSLIHYRGKVRIVTCDTLKEAEQALK